MKGTKGIYKAQGTDVPKYRDLLQNFEREDDKWIGFTCIKITNYEFN